MSMKDETFLYFENDLIQMVELPYKGEKLSMILILPASDNKEIFDE